MTQPTGVVVARFQTDELHGAHKLLLTQVAEFHQNMVVVLGVGRTPLNASNPLPFDARAEMVLQFMREYNASLNNASLHRKVKVVPLLSERSNEVWSQKLDELVERTAHGRECKLYCGRDGFKPFYTGKFKVEELDFGVIDSSTARRAGIVANPEFYDPKFRAGIIYAMNTKHFQTYRTVDMALFYDPGEGKPIEILMAKKPNETKWRFPGGFVDEHANETFAQAAAREMMEETGAISEDGWTLLQDFPIPDEWRIKGQKGVSHSTMLLKGWAATKHAAAADDIAEVRWFTVADIFAMREDSVVPEHIPLIDYIVKNYVYNKGGR